MRTIRCLPTLMLCALCGCQSLYKVADSMSRTHRAESIDAPATIGIIRDLPTSGQVTFSPDNISGAPNKVRVFVKNASWTEASPGGWYEIPWAVDVDTRTTEYAVISFVAQAAVVKNQPSGMPRAVIVETVPPNAWDPGIPSR